MSQRPRSTSECRAMYMLAFYRARALRICEAWDRAINLAPAKQKQDALVLAKFYLRKIAAR